MDVNQVTPSEFSALLGPFPAPFEKSCSKKSSDDTTHYIVDDIRKFKVPHSGHQLSHFDSAGSNKTHKHRGPKGLSIRHSVIVEPYKKSPWYKKQYIVKGESCLKLAASEILPGREWVYIQLCIARFSPQDCNQDHDPRPDKYPVCQKNIF